MLLHRAPLQQILGVRAYPLGAAIRKIDAFVRIRLQIEELRPARVQFVDWSSCTFPGAAFCIPALVHSCILALVD
jgi:hypothetical protein